MQTTLPMLVLLATRAWAADPSGSVMLTESHFNVREKANFEWIYSVGPDGFSPGDELRLRDPIFHGMRWSKWGDLSPWSELCTEQSDGQRASVGLVSAYAERDGEVQDDVTVGVERSNCALGGGGTPLCKSDIHLDTTTTLYLEGETGLSEGDSVHLVVGDVDGCRSRCEAAGESDCSICDDCGFQVPDRAFPEIRWTSEECLGADACVALDPAGIEVSAEATVNTVLVTVPSQARVGDDFTLKAALLDPYGNAVASVARTLTVDLQGATGSGDGASWSSSPADGGWHDFTVRLDEPGIYRLVVDTDSAEQGTSNPVEVFAEAPETSIYWGDVHVHHGLTWVDEDGFETDLNHTYARDVVGLDVVAESEKAAGIELDEDALWTELEGNCEEYTVEGDYLVLLAFEWMGDVAADEFGTTTEGHHNVYYDACEAPFGTHDTEVIANVEGDLGLWNWLAAVETTYGVHAVTVPHAMRFTGYNYDIANPGLQTLAEIYSEWGDNTTWTGDAAEGSTQHMLGNGLRLGWIGSSDNHDGWMGNPFSKKSKPSGLAAFVTPALTRADIWAAMRDRSTYATTGIRPILRFSAEDDGIVVPQGAEYVAHAPTLNWEYHGTDKARTLTVWGIEVAAGAEQVRVLSQTPAALDVDSGSVALSWDGTTPMAWWLEVVQDDGEKAWSSPIWVTADCDRQSEGAIDPLGLCDADTADTGDTGDTGDSGDSGDTGDGDTGGDELDPGQSDPGVRCGCSGNGRAAAVFLLPLGLLARRRRTQ